MISLRTKETHEYFELGSKFSVNFERTNSMLNTQGSYSYPCSIPASAHNLAIINNPQITDRNKRYQYRERVILENGARSIEGDFFLDTIDDNINFNIDVYEGSLFARMKDFKLSDLDWGGERPSKYAGPIDPDNWAWDKEFLEQAYNDIIYPQSDWAIFPVVLSHDENTVHVLNKIKFKLPETPIKDNISFIGDHMDFASTKGVTPFLYLMFILDNLFANFKVKIQINDLQDIPDLNRIVVMNNVVDLLDDPDTGTINYKHLLPTCTCNEFLKAVENTFACTFYINDILGTVNIKSHRKTLSEPVAYDLTNYVVRPPRIMYENGSKSLKVKPDTSLPDAGSNYETLEDLRSAFSSLRVYQSLDQIPIQGIYNHKQLFYVSDLFGFYKYTSDTQGRVTGTERESSLIFSNPHDPDKELMEIDTVAKLMTNYSYDQQVNISWNTIIIDQPLYPWPLKLLGFKAPMFQHEVRKIRSENLSAEDKYTTENVISFSIFRGLYNLKLIDPAYDYTNLKWPEGDLYQRLNQENIPPYPENEIKFPCGVTYDKKEMFQLFFEPNPPYAPGNSLYELWEPVSKWFSNSYVKFSCHMDLPLNILQKLELFQKVRIFNREYIIESWQEEHTLRGVYLGEFILRSVTPYARD